MWSGTDVSVAEGVGGCTVRVGILPRIVNMTLNLVGPHARSQND